MGARDYSEDDKRLIGTFHDQGLAHPEADAPPPKQRSKWIKFHAEGWQVASPRAWAEACGVARELLSSGERGHRVRAGEKWPNAIARVAGELLRSQKLGRPMGRVDPEWENIVRITARLGSTASDGRVPLDSGLRVTPSSIAS